MVGSILLTVGSPEQAGPQPSALSHLPTAEWPQGTGQPACQDTDLGRGGEGWGERGKSGGVGGGGERVEAAVSFLATQLSRPPQTPLQVCPEGQTDLMLPQAFLAETPPGRSSLRPTGQNPGLEGWISAQG